MSGAYKSLNGFATPSGTKKYLDYAIQKGKPSGHFRNFDGLYLSSIGMGTYLGQLSVEDDNDIENAVYDSIKSAAINVIDTAINYRAMKSEKNIGQALLRLINDGIISRDEVFICTKNGYITNDGEYPRVDVMEYMQKMFISTGVIKPNDISSGYNVLNPNYIARCIDKSLTNMHLNCIDLMYVHNAFESWYEDVNREEFMQMLSKVFEVYEKYRSSNKIKYYGMATWTCFRVHPNNREYLSLEETVKVAEKVGGKNHGFRFIQLPYNLVYSEAALLENQDVGSIKNLTILEAAERLNIGVFTSIPLFQSRLLDANIPDYAGLTDQVEKLIQIIRSTPSIMAPLIGQKKPQHVQQNIKLADVPPMSNLEYKEAIKKLFKTNL
ncbi:MAG TPA: aldo/keto reductase [Nitrososphaeraceae archaeon]|nr:aldo/keto reductase [Nitrososphaeraceae archaeon]